MRRSTAILLAIALVLGIAAALPAEAQTPTCGTVISTPGTTITFDSDMLCEAGFNGTALTIRADNVSVDGAGFRIRAPAAGNLVLVIQADNVAVSALNVADNSGKGLSLNSTTNSVLTGIDASGTGQGTGIEDYLGDHNTFLNNTATGRHTGLSISATNALVENNNFSNNRYYGIYGGGSGNRYINNNVAENGSYGIALFSASDFELTNNDFTGCGGGLALTRMDGVTLAGLDLSTFGIPGYALHLNSVTNSSFSEINASGSGATGVGIIDYLGDHNTFVNNTATGRHTGLSISATNALVENNNFSNNRYYGIYGGGSGNRYIDNNVAENGSYGIALFSASDFEVTNNDFTGCGGGLALTRMDGVTLAGLDLSTFGIPGYALHLNSVTNSSFSEINASGSGATGVGIIDYLGDHNTFVNNTATGRHTGLSINATNALVENCNFSNNTYYGINGGGSGNRYIDNNVAENGSYGIRLNGASDFEVTNNDFTGCGNGLALINMDEVILAGLDLSTFGIPGNGLYLNSVTNSSFSEINASGSGATGVGIIDYLGDHNTFVNNTATGRHTGLSISATNALVENCNFSNNTYYGINGGGSGNRYIDNNVAENGSYGIRLNGASDFEVTNNDFTGCGNGLALINMDEVILAGLDLSTFGIPGNGLYLNSVTNSSFSEINASGSGGTGTGITDYNGSGNRILNSTVTGRDQGLSINATNSLIEGNTFSNNVYHGITGGGAGNSYIDNLVSDNGYFGIKLSGSPDFVLINNEILRSAVAGIWLNLNAPGSTGIYSNTVAAGGGYGLQLTNAPGAQIYHNNIYGNAGYQVTSSHAIELSHEGEGNYWGRACPDDLFVAGVDSNGVDVVDSQPYRAEDSWEVPESPGCGPPPVSEMERSALEVLYYATDGANWTDSTGWLGPVGTECAWYGVTCEMDPSESHVTAILLPANNLVGTLPLELADLAHLEMLSLEANGIGGTIPAELGQLTALNDLRLGQNELAGTIPTRLGDLTNLLTLYLNQNQLDGEIPFELSNLMSLRVLNLSSNDLDGEIPWQLGVMTELTGLWLGGNQLDGEIPVELGNLTKLTVLNLAGNLLTGEVPYELGDLALLEVLDLTDNELSGSIPIELGTLVQLRLLSLAGNGIEGSIPLELGDLVSLQHLYLQGNRFEGPVPVSIGNLVNLVDEESDFRWNLLSTDDPVVDAFLVAKQIGEGGDWLSSQTAPPADVTVGAVTVDTIELSWTAAPYDSGPGGYRVLYRAEGAGSYTVAGTTADKTVTSFTVIGLLDDANYFLVVQTLTDAHGGNDNPLESDDSDEVWAATPPRNHPPVALCGPLALMAGPGCSAEGSIDDGSYDPDGDPIAVSQDPGGLFLPGDTSVTLTVTDPLGESAACSAMVRVSDVTAPVIDTCAADREMLADEADGLANVPDLTGEVTAADNCGNASTIQVPVAGERIAAGSHEAALSVYDPYGNSDVCTASLVVLDRMLSAEEKVKVHFHTKLDGAEGSCDDTESPIEPHCFTRLDLDGELSLRDAAMLPADVRGLSGLEVDTRVVLTLGGHAIADETLVLEVKDDDDEKWEYKREGGAPKLGVHKLKLHWKERAHYDSHLNPSLDDSVPRIETRFVGYDETDTKIEFKEVARPFTLRFTDSAFGDLLLTVHDEDGTTSTNPAGGFERKEHKDHLELTLPFRLTPDTTIGFSADGGATETAIAVDPAVNYETVGAKYKLDLDLTALSEALCVEGPDALNSLSTPEMVLELRLGSALNTVVGIVHNGPSNADWTKLDDKHWEIKP